MALVLGATVSTWQAVRAIRSEREQSRLREEANEAQLLAESEQRKAETEASRSRQVARFLQDMLQGVGPSVALGRDTTLVRDILDNTTARIGADLGNQPEVEADLRSTIGRVYYELGEFKKDESMQREALAIRRKLVGPEHAEVADSLMLLGSALYGQRKFAEAETVDREALALRITLFGPEHPDVAASLNDVGNMLRAQGSLPEAESMHRRALAMRRKLLGDEHLDVADSFKSLAIGIIRQGKVVEAEQLQREVLAIRLRLLGPEHLEVADSFDRVASALLAQRKLVEARTLYGEAIAMCRKLDPDNPQLARTLASLARISDLEGDLGEAESLYREAMEIFRKRLDADHPDLAEYSRIFALILCRQGKSDEAEALLRKLIAEFAESADTTNQPDYWRERGWIHHQLGVLLRNASRRAEAEIEFRMASTIWQQHPDQARIDRAKRAVEDEPEDVHRGHQLGEAFLESGQWAAAIEAFDQCLRLGSSPYQWFPLAIAHGELGHQKEARAWFERSLDWTDTHQDLALRQPQADAAVILGLPDPWGRSQAASRQLEQGDAFRGQGEMAQARAAYAEASKIYQTLAADWPNVVAYRNRLSSLAKKAAGTNRRETGQP